LRTVEDKNLHRLGGSAEMPLNVRLIAASSRSLADATHYSRPREDLYSRLKNIHERRNNGKRNRQRVPGNPVLVSMARQCPSTAKRDRASDPVARRPLLTAADLPADVRRASRKGAQFDLRIGDSLDNVEREFILKTLDFTHGNKVRAADILGVSLKTLYNRLDLYQGKKRDSADPSTELNDS
jgi:DNA-binding NtrC family response regulator